MSESMIQALNRIAEESGSGTAATVAFIIAIIFEAIKLLEIWLIAKVIIKALKKDLLQAIRENIEELFTKQINPLVRYKYMMDKDKLNEWEQWKAEHNKE